MPSGHTDTSTIAQRRPLTPEMLALLKRIAATETTGFGGYLDTGDKSRRRALMDRGLIAPHTHRNNMIITDAGRAALEQL